MLRDQPAWSQLAVLAGGDYPVSRGGGLLGNVLRCI